jgi:hypothetical protein
MGLDLTLLPFDHDSGEFCYSHTVLDCGRSYDLFDFIDTLPQIEVPQGFTSYVSRQGGKDTHYGKTTETPYGEPVKYTTASMLLTVPENIKATFSPKERAIWAYLEQLDQYTKVALFWR